MRRPRPAALRTAALCAAALLCAAAAAHTIEGDDARFVRTVDGPAVFAFMYLGAKHMATGYDHLLFLAGVVFFLRRPRHVVEYVTLFAVGHSVTLLLGVLADLRVDPRLIDAVIGLSIVYKAFENMGGFRRMLGFAPDPRSAVFVFGLFHGLGLAARLQAFELSGRGLAVNLLGFNLGVEIGQLLALSAVLAALALWRARPGFPRQAFLANGVLMAGGFLLAGRQLGAWALAPPY